jgi:uncharacterized RDD family membrane protein YckC
VAQATVGTYAGRDTQVIGRRVVATIIDGVLLAVVSGVLTAPGAIVSGQDGNAVGGLLSGLGALVFLALYFAYYIVMEGLYGRTLGKMAVGIRVIREDDGATPGFGKAALRTVLRIVDSIGSYLVAFIVVLISDKNQRLGDMVAKTLVVRA